MPAPTWNEPPIDEWSRELALRELARILRRLPFEDHDRDVERRLARLTQEQHDTIEATLIVEATLSGLEELSVSRAGPPRRRRDRLRDGLAVVVDLIRLWPELRPWRRAGSSR